MKRIVYYTNQFFGQIGGEERAHVGPRLMAGAVGPGVPLEGMIPGGTIVATVICGDNHYAENMERAGKKILLQIEKQKPDLFIAGPAFNAGRFGMACGDLCQKVSEALRIPVLTGMYRDNPAAGLYHRNVIIAETGKSAAGMRKALPVMAKLAMAMLAGESIGLPEESGYIPRGIRMNVFQDKTGAERALDMLVNKLNNQPYQSEISIPRYDRVVPAPPVDSLSDAKVALITTGGLVPAGNPDRLPAATAKTIHAYEISGLHAFQSGAYESVHAGYDPVYANQNPNVILPLDLMREAVERSIIKELHHAYYSTTGNSTSVADAERMGQVIAAELLEAKVHGAVITST